MQQFLIGPILLLKEILYIYILNIHRCPVNSCFTILKSWWRFIKTEMFNIGFLSNQFITFGLHCFLIFLLTYWHIYNGNYSYLPRKKILLFRTKFSLCNLKYHRRFVTKWKIYCLDHIFIRGDKRTFVYAIK